MIAVKVDVKGLDAELARLRGMGKQVAYAAKNALNSTAKKVADVMPQAINQAIDKPTPFTLKGVRVLEYASKERLSARVGFMAAQAKYMAWQIAGGSRQPGKAGLRLPTAINTNEYGNIPRGIIAQLVRVANKERKLGKVKARRIAVSNKVEIFYGDPADVGGHKFPRGIYKRVILGNGRAQLIPLIVFPQVSAKYKPRLDFAGKASAEIKRSWSSEFSSALDQALRTAR